MPRDGAGSIFELIQRFDFFRTSVPSFNIAGTDQVRTSIGGVLSISVTCITLLFALQKLQHMLGRSYPNINIYDDKYALTKDDQLELSSDSFQMAFVLEDTMKSELLDDPKFVRWYAI